MITVEQYYMITVEQYYMITVEQYWRVFSDCGGPEKGMERESERERGGGRRSVDRERQR